MSPTFQGVEGKEGARLQEGGGGGKTKTGERGRASGGGETNEQGTGEGEWGGWRRWGGNEGAVRYVQ